MQKNETKSFSQNLFPRQHFFTSQFKVEIFLEDFCLVYTRHLHGAGGKEVKISGPDRSKEHIRINANVGHYVPIERMGRAAAVR